MKQVPSDQLERLQPLLVVMLGEILKVQVTGTSSSSSAITWHRGAVTASEALAGFRRDAIGLLKQQYYVAPTDVDRRIVLDALAEATHTLPMGNASNQLVDIVLENTREVTEFYAEIAPTLRYELLQSLEDRAFRSYRSYRTLPPGMANDAVVTDTHDKLLASIRAFRDGINADRLFVIYKTLVGFESVFPPAWEDNEFDYEKEKAYREERIAELVDEVDDVNSEEWFAILTRCGQTQSNDGATFLSFDHFLTRLGEAKPDILMAYLDRMDEGLARFVPSMLRGLMKSARQESALAKVDQWVDLGRYLSEVARYLRSSEPFDEGMLQRVLTRALALGDDEAVLNALLAAVEQHKTSPGTLIESVFLPAVARLASKGDVRWVEPGWFSWLRRSILRALDADQAMAVLSALIPYPEIEHSAEYIVAALATRWPGRVIDFLGERQRFVSTNDTAKRYCALPFFVHELRAPLAAAPEVLIAGARRWFDEDDTHGFPGGHLLAEVFPEFPNALREPLKALVSAGDRRDIAFVLAVLHNYEGKSLVNDLCMDVVESLDHGDALLDQIVTVLTPRGLVRGEFGMAEAIAQKKSEIESWLHDPREKVRIFAEARIHCLEQQIATEQRSAEESIALRKLNYGEELGGD